MTTADYCASFSVITTDNAFFDVLKESNIFGSTAGQYQQPHKGKRLQTFYEGSPLPEITEVVKKFHEVARSFIAASETKQKNLYTARLHIMETKPFPGSPLSNTKGSKDFPEIIPVLVYMKNIGVLEYSANFVGNRGDGDSFRGFVLHLDSYLADKDEKSAVTLLNSPETIIQAIRYFRQYYG